MPALKSIREQIAPERAGAARWADRPDLPGLKSLFDILLKLWYVYIAVGNSCFKNSVEHSSKSA